VGGGCPQWLLLDAHVNIELSVACCASISKFDKSSIIMWPHCCLPHTGGGCAAGWTVRLRSPVQAPAAAFFLLFFHGMRRCTAFGGVCPPLLHVTVAHILMYVCRAQFYRNLASGRDGSAILKNHSRAWVGSMRCPCIYSLGCSHGIVTPRYMLPAACNMHVEIRLTL